MSGRRWAAAAFWMALFAIGYAVAWGYERRGFLSAEEDLLFDADPTQYRQWHNSMYRHPLIYFPVGVLGSVTAKVTGAPAEEARLAWALAVSPAAAVGVGWFTLQLLLRLGAGRRAAYLLTAAQGVSAATLSIGVIPESFVFTALTIAGSLWAAGERRWRWWWPPAAVMLTGLTVLNLAVMAGVMGLALWRLHGWRWWRAGAVTAATAVAVLAAVTGLGWARAARAGHGFVWFDRGASEIAMQLRPGAWGVESPVALANTMIWTAELYTFDNAALDRMWAEPAGRRAAAMPAPRPLAAVPEPMRNAATVAATTAGNRLRGVVPWAVLLLTIAAAAAGALSLARRGHGVVALLAGSLAAGYFLLTYFMHGTDYFLYAMNWQTPLVLLLGGLAGAGRWRWTAGLLAACLAGSFRMVSELLTGFAAS